MSAILFFLIVLDRAVNALLGGSFHETLSARAHEIANARHPYWGWTERFINFLFFWEDDHCRLRWLAEQERPLQPLRFEDYTKLVMGGLLFSLIMAGVIEVVRRLL